MRPTKIVLVKLEFDREVADENALATDLAVMLDKIGVRDVTVWKINTGDDLEIDDHIQKLLP